MSDDRSSVHHFPPGTEAVFRAGGMELDVTITKVEIAMPDHVLYEVAWVADGQIRSAWVQKPMLRRSEERPTVPAVVVPHSAFVVNCKCPKCTIIATAGLEQQP